MAAKYLDFDRFCNDSGSDYIQKFQRPKNDTEQCKLTICFH